MRPRALVLAALFAVDGCVAPAANRYDLTGARPVRTVAAHAVDRRRVTIVVSNRRAERARVFVLRAGQAPALVGVVRPLSRDTIDVTGSAPVGSHVRFAAVLEQGTQHVVSQEVHILRGGTVLIEIEADAPRFRTASTRVRPLHRRLAWM
jgi:hypothetical protein